VKELYCTKEVIDDRLNVNNIEVQAALENLFEVTVGVLQHHVDRRER
jgi:hypothetical protein